MERLDALRARVRARFTPVVACVTTPEVDAACAATGLSFGARRSTRRPDRRGHHLHRRRRVASNLILRVVPRPLARADET
jgi:hypothetical protein